MANKNQKINDTGTVTQLLPPLLSGLSYWRHSQGRTSPPEA